MSVHDDLAALRERQRDVIQRGFENGELEPCMTGTPSGGWACHRGGIGCTLAHEGDPPELHYIKRRQGRTSMLAKVLA